MNKDFVLLKLARLCSAGALVGHGSTCSITRGGTGRAIKMTSTKRAVMGSLNIAMKKMGYEYVRDKIAICGISLRQAQTFLKITTVIMRDTMIRGNYVLESKLGIEGINGIKEPMIPHSFPIYR